MKLSLTLILFAALFLGCSDDFSEESKDAFYKLYGNGTIQEAVAMSLADEGSIFMVGNQYVRNQDSAAVVLIRANEQGNQLWSGKYFGKGYTTARAIISLPTEDVLVLASSRTTDGTISAPWLFRISKEGDLLKEYRLGPEAQAGVAAESWLPEDMVLGDNGSLYIMGNIQGESVGRIRSFIQKMDLASGMILDERVFEHSERTEGKKIFRNGDRYFVLGNTQQEQGEYKEQNIFLAAYTANLVEDGSAVVGSAHNDTFEKAFLSSRNELVILSTEQEVGSPISRGVIRFTNPFNLGLFKMAYLDYSPNEVPQAIEEDENGDLYIAVNAFGDRGKTNILLNKTDAAAAPLWDAVKIIGGAGNDRIEEVKIRDGYVYLLSTLDMQNENTLISLSKIRF